MDIGMHAHTVRWEPSIRGAAPSEGPMTTNYDVGPLKGHKKSAKTRFRVAARSNPGPAGRSMTATWSASAAPSQPDEPRRCRTTTGWRKAAGRRQR
jgi:hypothetical protein